VFLLPLSVIEVHAAALTRDARIFVSHLGSHMAKSFSMFALGALVFASSAFSQTAAPVAGSSAAVTATCKDGTNYTGATLKGACRGHHGVNKSAGAANAAASAVSSVAPAATPAAAMPPVSGAANVWVNTSTKVYHCPGDKYYGKTKAGSYMSQADAKAKGYHADHGKACG
jgi:hypothetical protein